MTVAEAIKEAIDSMEYTRENCPMNPELRKRDKQAEELLIIVKEKFGGLTEEDLF